MTVETAVRVLIIEDEPLIALNLEELMIDSGFVVSSIAGRLAKALVMIENGAFDVALLDANLAGVDSGPAGTALAARGVPFLVLSGYSSIQQDGAFPGAASFMQKPFIPGRLVHALRDITSKV